MVRTVAFALAAVGALALEAAAAPSQLPDATADQVTTIEGGKKHESRFYVSGQKIRTETDAGPAGKMTMIMDLAGKKMWMLMPPPMGCIEQPLDVHGSQPGTAPLPPADAEQELVGEEKIDGHPTKKYKVTTTIDGTDFVQYQWRATDLNDFPIRSEGADGRYVTEFKNIKLGKPDAKLFQPPGDCKPASEALPLGMKGMHGHGGKKKSKAE